LNFLKQHLALCTQTLGRTASGNQQNKYPAFAWKASPTAQNSKL